jgi:hypothetical protein
MPFLIVLSVLLLVVLVVVWQGRRALQRQAFIREYRLPPGLFEKLRQRHPQLGTKECQLVAQALRQFFMAYLRGGRKPVAMPSQVVDDLWHEFILSTRHYERFCQQAFGRFLHHTPAAVLSGERRSDAGLRRCFWWACREENINPRQPLRLPLLFAIDRKLAIVGGFHYVLDCQALRETTPATAGATVHCASDVSGGYGSGGDTFGDGDSGGDGGDGGGDGGGGCGGE